MRRFRITTAAVILGAASTAFGQTINWVGPTTGDYNIGGNWSGGAVPNGGTLTANINPAASTTVTLDTISPQLRNLTVGAGHRLNMTDQNLELVGPNSVINNAGTITLFADLEFTSLYWGNNNVTLTGGGTVVLDFGDMGGDGGTFTNLNNTIRGGDGGIGFGTATFVNAGTVTQVAGFTSLFFGLRPGVDALINTGTVQTSSGTLTINGSSGQTINNNGGTLAALNGATLTLRSNLLVTGGTLRTVGTGVIISDFNARLASVNNIGHVRIRSGETIAFSGSNTNTGSITAQGAFSLGGGTVNVAGNGTINLGATLMSPGTAGVYGSGTLVSSNNIIGGGSLGAGQIAMRTSGRISTLNGGGILYIRPGAGGMVHTGTLNVASASFVNLNGLVGGIDLTGATVAVQGSGGDLQANGGSITGGAVTLDGRFFPNTATTGTFTSFRTSSAASPTGTLQLSGADTRITIRAGGGTLGTSRVRNLNITTAAGGALDITDHAFISDFPSTISLGTFPLTVIASAYNSGAWTGQGITSSTAAAAASTATKTGIGYARGDSLFTAFPATFHGQPVANPGAILLLYTLTGDTNLDRVVNIADFAKVAAKFNQPTLWIDGDFNYDGTTDIGDFALLAANFNKSLPADLPREATVPEPTGALVGLVAIATLRRRSQPRPNTR